MQMSSEDCSMYGTRIRYRENPYTVLAHFSKIHQKRLESDYGLPKGIFWLFNVQAGFSVDKVSCRGEEVGLSNWVTEAQEEEMFWISRL